MRFLVTSNQQVAKSLFTVSTPLARYNIDNRPSPLRRVLLVLWFRFIEFKFKHLSVLLNDEYTQHQLYSCVLFFFIFMLFCKYYSSEIY